MALRKNPKYDIKSKYQRIWEISLILALGFLIIAFKYYPKFEQEIVQIEISRTKSYIHKSPVLSSRLEHLISLYHQEDQCYFT